MSSRSPLLEVLAAVAAGAASTAEVSRRTGLDPDRAEAALSALAAAGRIRRVFVLAGACPTQGCRSCGQSRGCASAGAGSLAGSGLSAWRVVAR